jgi:hypothetical protein
MQAMLPPPAAETLDVMDLRRAIAVLVAMDADKAAGVLTQLGSLKAASKLLVSTDRGGLRPACQPGSSGVVLPARHMLWGPRQRDSCQQKHAGRCLGGHGNSKKTGGPRFLLSTCLSPALPPPGHGQRAAQLHH